MNITQYTNQEAFDRVWKKITEQGVPSREADDIGRRCRYACRDGRRCAIGHLVTNEELAYIARSLPLTDVEHTHVGDIASAVGIDVRLAKRFQAAHDRAPGGDEFIPQFHRRMRDIANQFGLKVPGPKGD